MEHYYTSNPSSESNEREIEYFNELMKEFAICKNE